VLRIPGRFNRSLLNNKAVAAARGEYLCFVPDDVEAVTQDWLFEMYGRMAESTTGAVGALVSWPNGVVQHAGIVLGPRFSSCHAFTDRMIGDPGYGDLLSAAHECSAVTDTVLLVRREHYSMVGGLDETAFPLHFGEIDLCLKLRARGQRIVVTPHAQFKRRASAPSGAELHPDDDSGFARELRLLRMRWGEVLINDPYYNPLLTLEPPVYAGLGWPPRECNPRLRDTAIRQASE
jgi:hypothetical protein